MFRSLNYHPQGAIWSLLTPQRGVACAESHSENITCRGMATTGRHATRSHSLDNISTT
jgi:hypothetical protein